MVMKEHVSLNNIYSSSATSRLTFVVRSEMSLWMDCEDFGSDIHDPPQDEL